MGFLSGYFKDEKLRNTLRKDKLDNLDKTILFRALRKKVLIKKNLEEHKVLTCKICSLPFLQNQKITVDHKFPKSKGGKTIIPNLQLAHDWCNHNKGNKI